MANELGPICYTTGASLRAVLFDAAGQVRDIVAGAWVAPGVATFANCLVALAEQGASGVYLASLPAGLDAGTDYRALIVLAAATGFGDLASQVAEGIVGPSLAGRTLPATEYATAAGQQAIAERTSNLPDEPAAKGDVQVTVPAPIVQPTPPAELSEASLALVREGLATGAALEQVADDVSKVKAAVRDSAALEGDTLTLSDGATMQITETGRTTVEPA